MAHDILIVDDEPDIRMLIDGILADEGYETRNAGGSDGALAAFHARRPSLIVLDVWLQGSRMDGIGLLETFHGEEPHVPVVMISGHGTIEMAVGAIQHGAYDFIEKPFQNWTRASAQLLGSVLLWVDYSLPLEETRQAVRQIVEASPLWDRRFWNLQVSDASERAMQIRVLCTAADASKAWDLRCEVREKLIVFIQQHHPRSLPRLRADWERPVTGKAP